MINTKDLEDKILDIMNIASEDEGDPKKARERFAKELSVAIVETIKSATVTINAGIPVTTSSGTGSTTGQGTGNIK